MYFGFIGMHPIFEMLVLLIKATNPIKELGGKQGDCRLSKNQAIPMLSLGREYSHQFVVMDPPRHNWFHNIMKSISEVITGVSKT